MKNIVFMAELNRITVQPRNDGDIAKVAFIGKAEMPEAKALLAVYGKTMDLEFSHGGDTAVMGGCVAEFKQFTPTAKVTGNIIRIGFTIRAHDSILLALLGSFREDLQITVSPDGQQSELFPDAEEEEGEIETMEDPTVLEA